MTATPEPQLRLVHVRENRVGGYIIRTVTEAEAGALIQKGGHERISPTEFHEACISGIVVKDSDLTPSPERAK